MLRLDSYNVQGNAIYIKHFDDRLEFSNSAPLPAQINEWCNYKNAQKKILQYLFYHNQVTVSELVDVTGINEKTVRLYLNQFMDNEKILDRLSEKLRDKNAKYAFRKI